MDIPIFYAPPEKWTEEEITLAADETGHAVKVMRLKKGDPVMVVDGLGAAGRGEIRHIAADRKRLTVSVHSRVRNFGESSVPVTLAAGLSVGSKFDTIVQQGTELGIKRFVPIISEKSKVKFDDPKRAASRVKRLEKVALAAIKQSRRAYRPDISTPMSLDAFLKETDAASLNLLFHPGTGSKAFAPALFERQPTRVCALVGPESGFSEAEISRAVVAGFLPVSLGPRILRAETAGAVVCALIMGALGELR